MARMNAESPATTVPARHLTVDERHAGQRIDNFLILCLKGVPKSRIYRILRRGEVRVNQGRKRQDYRLQEGDVVRIPPLRYEAERAAPQPGQRDLRAIGESVLYEDRNVLVLDKPAGMAVHGGSGRSYGVIEALRALRPDDRFLELVHRLDRDTSGCLMVARRRSALRSLHAALREGRVDKRYLALVQGRWRGGARTVDAPLRKNQLRSGERVVRVDAEGREARTRFVPRATSARASLVEAQLLTGRTHQVRVHAASVGHPLAGDGKYGERMFNKQIRELGLRRHFLHAASLRFPDPDTGEPRRVEAPLPADLLEVVDALGMKANG